MTAKATFTLLALLLGASQCLISGTANAATSRSRTAPSAPCAPSTTVTLEGAQVAPPTLTAGTGQCLVTLNSISGQVTVSGSYSGLTGSAVSAHLHGPAAAGVNGGVILSFSTTGGTSGTFSGSGTLTPANIANMLGSLTYVDIHTTSFGGGELRGQVVRGRNRGRGRLSLQITSNPRSTVATEDSTAFLEVIAHPREATYLWRKEGVPLSPPRTSNRLTFAPVTLADAGSYDVLVSFRDRTLVSQSAILDVTEATQGSLAELLIPEDAGGCGLSPSKFNGWFESGAVSLDGLVTPPDNVSFPDVPNCDFYQWSERMFLWLTSVATPEYGGGGEIVMNTRAFFEVSPPDPQNQNKRHYIEHTPGNVHTALIAGAQHGPLGLPVVFDGATQTMYEIVPPVLSRAGRPIVRDSSGDEVEVGGLRFDQDERPVLLDLAGADIEQPRLVLRLRNDPAEQPFERKLQRLESHDGFDRSKLVQRVAVGGQVVQLGTGGDFIKVETGQAPDGAVLMSQQESLVYYTITVNNVMALYRTMLGATVPANTRFPTSQAELDDILDFAAANGRSPVVDSEALAVEIKASWVELESVDEPTKFITMRAYVPKFDVVPDLPNPPKWVRATGVRATTLALVGMHIACSTGSTNPSNTNGGHPELLWATFEHISNSPSVEYKYKVFQSSDTPPVPQNTTGKWLFCADGSTGAFNVKRMEMDGDDIVPVSSSGIGPTDVLRLRPWGLAGTNAIGNAEVIRLNWRVRSMLDPDDVRRNYIHHGTTWTAFGVSPSFPAARRAPTSCRTARSRPSSRAATASPVTARTRPR
jgi:hypothetical protein